jgi:uncharacterized protein
MRILFTSDLHGKKHLYREMTALVLKTGAQCIILGGDLFPTHIARPLGLLTGSADFQEGLIAQQKFIEDFLAPYLDGFMESHPDICLIYVPGNHDWMYAINHLKKKLPKAICLHEQSVDLNGLSFFGYGCVTDSSFWVKDYVRRDRTNSNPYPSRYAFISTEKGLKPSEGGEYALKHLSIEEELSRISIKDPSRTICIFHSPPYNTCLDTLYNGKPIGSTSIRNFIERHQPLVSLHGHIHESPYMSGIFSTNIDHCLSINPGHSSRALHAVIFDTEDPSGSLSHSIFHKAMPQKRKGVNLFERYCRSLKSSFMQKTLTEKRGKS